MSTSFVFFSPSDLIKVYFHVAFNVHLAPISSLSALSWREPCSSEWASKRTRARTSKRMHVCVPLRVNVCEPWFVYRFISFWSSQGMARENLLLWHDMEMDFSGKWFIRIQTDLCLKHSAHHIFGRTLNGLETIKVRPSQSGASSLNCNRFIFLSFRSHSRHWGRFLAFCQMPFFLKTSLKSNDRYARIY